MLVSNYYIEFDDPIKFKTLYFCDIIILDFEAKDCESFTAHKTLASFLINCSCLFPSQRCPDFLCLPLVSK